LLAEAISCSLRKLVKSSTFKKRKLIYLVGERIRNPSLKERFAFLKDSESWNKKELHSYQLERLNALLLFAKENSTFYSHNLKGIALPLTNLDELKEIVIAQKSDLINRNSDISTVDSFEFPKIFRSETSGTSGQTLEFYKDEFWDSCNRASIRRGLSWYGVEPWDRNGYLWGFNIRGFSRVKTYLADMLLNRFRLFTYSPREAKSFVSKLSSVKYLHGYSSMIYEMAKMVNDGKLEIGKSDISLIKGTSEKIFDFYQVAVKKAFGSKIVSEYGSAEAGIVAFECPHGKMHVNMENCIVEVDSTSEILVTNLNSYSFPIIRYRLGDIVSLETLPKRCGCGLSHDVIFEVTGRVGKKIHGQMKSYPSLMIYYIFKNLYFDYGVSLDAQFIQFRKGFLSVSFMDALDDGLVELVRRECLKYFDGDIIVEFEGDCEPRSYDGKRRDFISYVD
jgi:phenylacetate-CoA ligase